MKPWYLSKTVVGALLVAVGAIIPAIPYFGSHPDALGMVQKALEFLGTILFGVGVRSAISKNGAGV